MLGLVKKIFGDDNDRQLRQLSRIAEKINALASSVSSLTDEGLSAETVRFRSLLAKGETIDQLLPEAYAVVREAAWRVLAMRHFDVQLLGGIALHQGSVVEMKTGEGKTLASTLPIYLNALLGNGVHVVTVNDYLAERDSQQMGQIFRFLGLTVGCNRSNLTRQLKRQAYQCDITYGTSSEFGFDYLRDNMAMFRDQIVQRPLSFALIDEVDSVLIDEARTPLIISGQAQKSEELYYQADRFASQLSEEEDFTIDARMRTIVLTEKSVNKAEKAFNVDNLFSQDQMILNHHINQALRARYMLKRDVDYVIKDDGIIIVDEYTGRLMTGRRYSDGLHQAIEAKENLNIQHESKTQATITLQNYFRVYDKLAGMTGTAQTEEDEFMRVYGLDVVQIPTFRPNIREDLPDLVYKTANGKYEALIADIDRRHQKGQPVLVGTISIEDSERLSVMLQNRGISHQVLNAKLHEEEARIIGQAGQRGAVTIATNMAGRGTDILLGEGVTELGGLHIIGTERHESRRIDNQLRGRAGRQGDPGSSQFYLSMEDNLMLRFGSPAMTAMLERLGFDETVPMKGDMMSRGIESAQRIVEGANFETLMRVMHFDDVINRQREKIYRDRKEILEDHHTRPIVMAMIRLVTERAVHRHCPAKEVPENWDLLSLAAYANQNLLPEDGVQAEELWNKEPEEIVSLLMERSEQLYDRREKRIGEAAMRKFEQIMVLRIVDAKWIDHIDAMDQLREGIHLRAIGSGDPLHEYQVEGHQMFLAMVERIEEEVSHYVLKVKIAGESPEEQAI